MALMWINALDCVEGRNCRRRNCHIVRVGSLDTSTQRLATSINDSRRCLECRKTRHFTTCEAGMLRRAGSAFDDPLIQLLIDGLDRVIDLGIGQAKLM